MTAVEWLKKQLNSNSIITQTLLNQAKEMERDQIEDAYIQGFCECDAIGIMDTEKYYRETYNK